MNADQRHCGWSNYQTWAVNLYLGDYFTERTAEYIEQGGEVSAHDVADNLRTDFEQIIYARTIFYRVHMQAKRFPDNDKREGIDNLIADLFGSATEAINWRELAEAYLDNIGATY